MNISTGIAVACAVVVALSFMFLGTWVFAPFTSAPEEDVIPTGMSNEGTTLMVVEQVVGTGEEAIPGKRVSVHYVGHLENGTVFDASANHGGPFTFTLGAGEVIQGWEQGISGMREGGKRRLIVPPELAYGNRQIGPIPPNSTLVFDVELVSVE